MKKHNLIKVLVISILVVVLLSWILPTASYQYGSLVEAERAQIGFYELFTYPTLTFSYFGYILLFALVTGGFYGILKKTGVYRKMLDKIVAKFKGKENIFLGITISLIAIITSVSGLNFAMFFLFPMIISLVLLMGYNKLVAATVTLGGVFVGYMGTTLGEQNVAYINSILGTTYQDELLTKVVILVIGIVLLVFNVLRYAKKVKVEKIVDEDGLIPTEDAMTTVNEVIEEKVVKAKTKEKNKKNAKSEKKDTKKKVEKKAKVKTKKIWPMVVVFDLLLVVMILSFLPWSSSFDITWFDDALTAISEFQVFGFPLFGKLLGGVLAFGNWAMNDLTIIIFIASVIIALIYRVKVSEYISSFIEGAKKMLLPGFLMMFIYAILIIVTYHPFQLVITKALLGLTEGFNVVTMGIVAILSSIFNIDTLYVAQSTIPYVTSVITDTTLYPLISVMFQSLYAFTMLFAPTSLLLLGTLAYLKVPYGEWLKHIWKFLLQMLIILFVIFTIILLV